MLRSVNDIAGPKLLQRFARKGSVQHGLPAFAYTNQDFWLLEQEKLFANACVFVGFAHEIAGMDPTRYFFPVL